MRDTSLQESVIEKKCPLCGRGLARIHGPEIPCTLCVRLGPPPVRRKGPTLKQAAICAAERKQISNGTGFSMAAPAPGQETNPNQTPTVTS
jgi:hypothetical protein